MVMVVMGKLRVILFKASYEPFVSLLKENDIEYKELHHPVGVVMAAGSTIEVISAIANASPWGALAFAIVAWVNKQARRSVIITLKNKEIVNIHTQGYSVKDVERILENTEHLTVIDASNKKT